MTYGSFHTGGRSVSMDSDFMIQRTYFSVCVIRICIKKFHGITNVSESFYTCQIQEDCYEPIFRKNDVIALKKRNARHNELGIFCLNGICYIRTLFQKGEDCRLCSLNVVDSDIEVKEGDSLICVGTILGKVFGDVEISVQKKSILEECGQLKNRMDEETR